jgi:ribosomal protein S18 acetylase RimI-like enzyme
MSVSKNFTIRAATERDGEKIAVLARRIWAQCYREIISQEQIDYMLDQRFSMPGLRCELLGEAHQYWMILSAEEAVGYGVLSLPPVDQRCRIQQVYIDASVRGLGLGRRLLDIMIKEAVLKGAQKVWLSVNRNNADAIEFYRHLGFSQIGTVVTDIGKGFVMDDFRMEKSVLGADECYG